MLSAHPTLAHVQWLTVSALDVDGKALQTFLLEHPIPVLYLPASASRNSAMTP
jgi:hypothetical protein